MSEESQSPQTSVDPPAPESATTQPTFMRPLIMTVVVILLLMITVWAGGMRANQARIAEIERSVNALSEAIEPTALQNDTAKLNRVLLDIAEAGKYRAVTYANNAGTIIATTDAVRMDKSSKELAKAPATAKASTENGMIVVRRAVILAGDTRLGNIEVVLN